jgi:hypothetical protein
MNRFARLSALCIAILGVVEAFGFSKTMYPYEKPDGKPGAAFGAEYASPGMKLEPGKWYTNMEVCKKYADDNGMPLLAVWGNAECIHCWYTEYCFIQDAFKEWQATHNQGQVICCIMAGGEAGLPDQKNSKWYNWMYYEGGRKLGAFPFVVMWWKEKGVNVRMTGDEFCADIKGGDPLALNSTFLKFTDNTIPQRIENITKRLEKAFEGWNPVSYEGGFFDVPEGDSLQIEPDTQSLYIPLRRSTTAAASQTIEIVRSTKLLGAPSGSFEFSWSANVTNQVIEIPNFGSTYYSAGARIELKMYNPETGDLMSSTAVECVDEQENSTTNPLWIGERTADTLQAGEWTMDLDVALARTAAQTGDAYTLVYVTGALWCPWCRGLDHYVLETEAFATFVAEKNVSLVCLDNLRRGKYDSYNATNEVMSVNATPSGAGPSLLSYKSGTSGNGTASGTSYLSRKGIAPEDAESVLQRNIDLGYVGGAYATPDAYRTGYPTMILLDKAGKIVGRWATVSSSDRDSENRYKYDSADSMTRLADLFKNASEAREAGRYATTTPLSLQVGLGADVELSVNAPQQTMLLENLPSGKVSLYISSNDSPFSVSLSLVKLVEHQLVRKDGDGKVVSTETVVMPEAVADAAAGSALVHEFSAEDAKGTFALKVVAATPTADAEPFVVGVGSSPVLTPGEVAAEYTPVSSQVTLDVVEGEVYKLEGAWLDLATSFTETNGLWIANETYRAVLAVTPGSKVSYQIWHPGEVGFTAASRSVREDAGIVAVPIARTGGVSGAVTVSVTLDAENTDLYDSDGKAKFEFESFETTWDEGDDVTVEVPVTILDDVRYDGHGKVTLLLSVTEGESELGTSTFVLNVNENDTQSPGKAAFVGADPFFSAKATVYAKASAGATVKVGRVEASDGPVTVKVSTTAAGVTLSGDVENGIVSWGTHKFEEKSILVSGLAAGKTARLTLSNPTGGLKVLSASNAVTVVSVPDSAPEFAEPAASMSIYRYVAMSNTFALAAAPSGRMTFSKTFGTLPAGLKVAYDAEANALALFGATTAKAGTYKSVYRAKDGATAGLSLELTIEVIDPTDPVSSPEAANPTVAVSRTFKDIPVVNDVNNRLAGVLQVTIPTKGNVSAKYSCEFGTVSFSAKNWNAFDAASKDLSAELSSTKSGYALSVIAQADGSVDFVLTDPNYPGISLDATVEAGSAWSKANPASAWAGYYTVALSFAGVDEDTEGLAPRGTGYLTLKMNTSSAVNAGKFTWAGVLPNGTAISGSSVLTYGEEWGTLPVFKASTSDALSVLLKVLAGGYERREARSVMAADGVNSCWEHVERDAEANADYIVELGVHGGPFDPALDLAACCEEAYETNSPTAVFDTSALTDVSYGEPGASPVATVVVEPARLSFAPGAPAGLTLTLNRSTGIVSGSVKITFGTKLVSAQWKGVLLQGWGPGCLDCGPGDINTEYRPFINGTFFFSDKIGYQVGGRNKTVTVKRGGNVKAE